MLFITCFLVYGKIEITPGSWDFGTIREGEVVEKIVTFINSGSKKVSIHIIPTCDCTMSQPLDLNLAPGAESTARFLFDSTGETGEMDRSFLIKTDIDGQERIIYSVTGTVLTEGMEVEEEETSQAEESGLPVVEIDYYYSPNCAICQKFINSTIPKLEDEFTISINLNKKDIINDTDMYMEYVSRMESLGEKERAIPVLILGSTVLQGSDEIDKKIKNVLRTHLTGNTGNQENDIEGTEDLNLSKKMAILPAIGAGLLDGINPCAFATLISLLAALALAGKRRKEILVIGIFFTLSVFTTYYLVGLGAFSAIRAASTFPIVALIINWVLVGVLFVFAGLSLWDFYLIRKGRSNEMVLQLPDTFKKKIQKTIKTRVRSAAIVASSITLGFLVSLFELACTGQVYFPFITAYVLKIKQNAFGYILLLVYNLGFIFPLVLVFAVTYSGINSKKITKLFQKNMGIVKLLLAALFIALALYMILTK
jgi:cytochrome c biogenesis protein CcdA